MNAQLFILRFTQTMFLNQKSSMSTAIIFWYIKHDGMSTQLSSIDCRFSLPINKQHSAELLIIRLSIESSLGHFLTVIK